MSYDVVVVGSYNQDQVWVTHGPLPVPGETRLGEFASGPGGKGFNQAVAARRQGVATCFIGALGRDALGAQARETAAAFDLPALWEEHATHPTGTAGIVVDEAGANLIVVAPGANMHLSAAFVRSHAVVIANARVLVAQVESKLDATRAALALAREQNVLSILNTAPINPAVDAELIGLADIITPNETEFADVVTRCFDVEMPERFDTLPDPALHALCRATGVPTVVLTLGDKGCFVSHADAAARGDASAHYRVAAERVTAIDTVGAGDAFTGGLAAGLVLFGGSPFRAAVVHAGRVAGLSTENRGAAGAMPTRDALAKRFG